MRCELVDALAIVITPLAAPTTAWAAPEANLLQVVLRNPFVLGFAISGLVLFVLIFGTLFMSEWLENRRNGQ